MHFQNYQSSQTRGFSSNPTSHQNYNQNRVRFRDSGIRGRNVRNYQANFTHIGNENYTDLSHSNNDPTYFDDPELELSYTPPQSPKFKSFTVLLEKPYDSNNSSEVPTFC